MKFDVHITGYIGFDFITKVSRNPHADQTGVIEKIQSDPTFGGCVTNIAVALARLGLNIAVSGIIGDDKFGRRYLTHLKNENVNIRDIIVVKGADTTYAYMFVSEQDGGTQVFFYPGVTENWRDDLDLKEAGDSKACLITCGPTNYNQQYIQHFLKKDIPIFWQMKGDVKAYTRDLVRILYRKCNVLFMNQSEADYVMECLNKKTIETLIENENQTIVLTLGKKGSRVINSNKDILVPGVKTDKLVDTTGAGDGFTAGFIYGWLNNLSLETNAKLGATLASFVVEKKGCQTNLPSLYKLRKRFKKEFNASI